MWLLIIPLCITRKHSNLDLWDTVFLIAANSVGRAPTEGYCEKLFMPTLSKEYRVGKIKSKMSYFLAIKFSISILNVNCKFSVFL